MPERVEEPFVLWGCKLFEKGFEGNGGNGRWGTGGGGGVYDFLNGLGGWLVQYLLFFVV